MSSSLTIRARILVLKSLLSDTRMSHGRSDSALTAVWRRYAEAAPLVPKRRGTGRHWFSILPQSPSRFINAD